MLDHFAHVLAIPDDDGSARHLAFAVQLRNAPTHFRSEFNTRNVTHADRRAVVTDGYGEVLNIG